MKIIPENHLSMRYRLGVVDRIPSSRGKELLRCRATDESRLLPIAISHALIECSDFETLLDLAKKLYGRLYHPKNGELNLQSSRTSNDPSAKTNKVLGNISRLTNKWLNSLVVHDSRFSDLIVELQTLAEAGFLVSEDDLLYGNSRLIDEEERKKISTLGVVTKDRPGTLRQCVSSYLNNVTKWGKSIEVAVMDDSSNADNIAANRSLLTELSLSHGMRICHASRPEKIRFADLLSRHGGIKRETIDFALFGLPLCDWKLGANRNALTLHTVGELILSVDDDTICHSVETPSPKPGLAVCCQADPEEFWFFSDRQAALNFAPKREVDILAAHERVLGRTLAQIVNASAPGEVSLVSLCASLLESFQSRQGNVVLSYNGLLGDCALYTSFTLLLNKNADTRGRFLRTKQEYDLASQTREVLRVASHPHILHGGPWLGAVFGFDNSRLLPPFMPLGWGEDVLLGFAINRCIPDAYFGHLPLALLHAPPADRAYVCHHLETADRLRIDDVMVAAIAAFQPRLGRVSPDLRLKDLGSHLADFAGLAEKDFREEVIRHLFKHGAELTAQLESLLAEYGGPRYWEDDIRAWLDRKALALTKTGDLFPSDVARGGTAQEAWASARTIMSRYAELLMEWPAMISAASHLRSKGIRMAQPLCRA